MSPRKLSRDYMIRVVTVARKLNNGLRQNQIAREMRMSQPEVSRASALAKKLGILVTQTFLKQDAVDQGLWEESDQRYFTNSELMDKFKSWAPPGHFITLRVMPGTGPTFSAAATPRVIELVSETQMLGVMWGHMIARIRETIAAHPKLVEHKNHKDLQCIPLCGDPLHLENEQMVEESSSKLAIGLERLLTGKLAKHPPTLVGVPAFISRNKFKSPAERAVLQRFLEFIPGYKRIFGLERSAATNDVPLVDRVGGLLTGAGVISEPVNEGSHRLSSFIQERRLQEPNLSTDQLTRLIHGDLGGLLIEREGLSKRDKDFIRELNDGWVGFKFKHLERMASEAKPYGPPGVILVVEFPEKAPLIKRLLELGLVNHLIINKDLASALMNYDAS